MTGRSDAAIGEVDLTGVGDGVDGLFGRLAVHAGLITYDQLVAALIEQGRLQSPPPIGEMLIELGHLTVEQVEGLLRQQADVLTKKRAADEKRRRDDAARAEQAREQQRVGAVQTLLSIVRGGGRADEGAELDIVVDEAARTEAPAAAAPPAVANAAREWIEQMLAAALVERASDIHFHADERLRMRVHGRLLSVSDQRVPAHVTEAGLLALLPPDVRRRFDADNQVELSLTLRTPRVDGRFRVSVFRQLRGVDGTFRTLPARPPTLHDLGLPPMLARLTPYHQGIVLCTGPASCGKSSTMAALVHTINEERAEHIVTIEDPIEVVHPSLRCVVNQRQIGRDAQSFSRALKSALREDPDVIVIGEMRDRDTASLALTAAETGHLVLATLHTPSAVRTINRIIGEFPPTQQPTVRSMLSESLRAVVNNRLVRRKDGTGVVAAIELLTCTPAVAHLIRDSRTHQIRSAMQTGAVHGMQTLDGALRDLVDAELVDDAGVAEVFDEPRARADADSTPTAGD